MLDINFIRQNPGQVRDALTLRRAEADLEGVLALDRERRDLLQHTEKLKSERNRVSKEIGHMKFFSRKCQHLWPKVTDYIRQYL